MQDNNDILSSWSISPSTELKNEIPAAATTLYVRLSESSLYFARYADGRPPYFDFCQYRLRPRTSLTVNLREAIDSEQIIHSPYQRVEILVQSATTLVPLSDFQEEDCETIYNYCFPNKQKRKIFYDTIPGANAVLLFSLDENTYQALENAFENVRYTSALTPVMRHFSTRHKGDAHRVLYVYCHEQQADISVYEDYRLIIANSYQVYNAADVAYYAMNIAQQTGVKAENDPIIFVEGIGAPADVHNEVRRFAANVQVINPEEEFKQHIVATTTGVPYDLKVLLINK